MRNRQRYRSNKHGAYILSSVLAYTKNGTTNNNKRMESCDQGSSLQSTVGCGHCPWIYGGSNNVIDDESLIRHEYGWDFDVSNISLFEGSKNQGFDEMW